MESGTSLSCSVQERANVNTLQPIYTHTITHYQISVVPKYENNTYMSTDRWDVVFEVHVREDLGWSFNLFNGFHEVEPPTLLYSFKRRGDFKDGSALGSRGETFVQPPLKLRNHGMLKVSHYHSFSEHMTYLSCFNRSTEPAIPAQENRRNYPQT